MAQTPIQFKHNSSGHSPYLHTFAQVIHKKFLQSLQNIQEHIDSPQVVQSCEHFEQTVQPQISQKIEHPLHILFSQISHVKIFSFGCSFLQIKQVSLRDSEFSFSHI